MNTRIVYLRDSRYTPTGCVAMTIDEDSRTVSYGYSVLNPTDRFNRKLGRQLALGRMLEQPVHLTLTKRALTDMFEITRTVMEDLAHDLSAPSRAVKSAKNWMSAHQTRTLVTD